MKIWFKNLSNNQLKLTFLIIFFSIIIITTGYLLKPEKNILQIGDFSINDTIKITAQKLGVTGKSFARELNIDIDTPKNIPVKNLGITKEQFNQSIQHLLSHQDASIKYYIYFVIFITGLFYLINIGKAANLKNNEYKHNYPLIIYLFIIAAALAVNGFLLGKSPNPMEGVVKVFKSFAGLYPDPIIKITAMLFFIILSIIANKIICGWACPIGALQELIYSMPVFKKIKKKKIPFVLTNTIRTTLFITALIILFGAGNKKGTVIYHYINPFNLFNYDFETMSILLTVIFSILLSFIIYRPYCQFICPFGFISWLFERLSFYKVRVNDKTCIKCGACIKTCPTGAITGIINNKKNYPDCFSCSRCLNVCPCNALEYKTNFFKKI